MSIVLLNKPIVCAHGEPVNKSFRFWKDRAKTIPWDFTGCSTKLTLKKTSSIDSDPLFERTGEPTLVINGNVLSIHLEPDDLTPGDWIGKAVICNPDDTTLQVVVFTQDAPLSLVDYV